MMVVQLYRLPIVYLILRQLHWKFMKIIQQKEREREAAARPDERSLVQPQWKVGRLKLYILPHLFA